MVDHYVCTSYTIRYHNKPSRAAQRNQNLTTVFAFMTDIEHLPIADISKSNTHKVCFTSG